VNTTVFVGGGRITSALVSGLCRAGYRGVIVVHDRNPRKLRALERDFGIAAEPDLQSAAVAKVLDAIAGCTGAPRLLIVSLAAGDSPQETAPTAWFSRPLGTCFAEPDLPHRTRSDGGDIRSPLISRASFWRA
jgi:NAD(P)-dependent dehydrogenase (short-subunit alcohol dehydrogenase family)